MPTSHHPIPSSPYTVAPHHLATSHHPCYQLSLSCTTNHTVVVQHPYCSAPTPPYAVTLQPPAQLWTSSTPLHPTLHNPIPSVPHRVVAQHHHLPKPLSPSQPHPVIPLLQLHLALLTPQTVAILYLPRPGILPPPLHYHPTSSPQCPLAIQYTCCPTSSLPAVVALLLVVPHHSEPLPSSLVSPPPPTVAGPLPDPYSTCCTYTS